MKTRESGGSYKSAATSPFFLLWTVVLGLLGLTAIFLGTYIHVSYERIANQDADSLTVQARVISLNLGHQLKGVYNVLTEIRSDLPSWLEQDDRLESMKHRLTVLCNALPGTRTVSVIDAEGNVLSSSRTELIGRNFADREYFKRPEASRDLSMLYLSPPYTTSVSNLLVMNAAVRISGEDGGFGGIVTATLDPNYFKTLMSSVLYAPDMLTSLIHGDGLLFLTSPEREGMALKDLRRPESFYSRHMESGKSETRWKGKTYTTGENRTIAMITFLPQAFPVDVPLIIVASRSWDAVMASWRRESLVLGAIYVLVFLGSITVIRVLVARRLEVDRLLRMQASILESAGEGIFGVDDSGNVSFMNNVAQSLTGWDSAKGQASSIPKLCFPSRESSFLSCSFEQNVWATLRDGQIRKVQDESFVRPNDSEFFVDYTVAPLFGQEQVSGAVVVMRDTTRRRHFEEELLHVNKAMKILSACNQALIKAPDEASLLREVCRIIVDEGGYSLCWVGYSHCGSEGIITPMAQWGYADGDVKSLKDLFPEGEEIGSPFHQLLRDKTPCICNDLEANFEFEGWCRQALVQGYASAVMFPLKSKMDVIGALGIYASKPDAFTGRRLHLLEELAQDLTFGIETLRSQQKAKQLATAVEKSSDWILITDRTGRIEYVNQAVEQMTGYTKEEVLGKTPRIFKSGQYDSAFYREMWDTILSGKTFVGILTNRRKNGQLFEVFHTVTPLEDHNRRITHFVATSKDITAHRQLEERNHYLAYYDGLTGLANRSLLTDRVKQAIARAEHHEQLAGVAFIDVDRFHLINDVFGAALGDRLLKETARRLSEYVREGDTAARLGSDEYAVLFNDLARSEDIIFLLEELMEVLSEPITTEDKQTILTFSIGVSVYPNDTRDSESLLQNADMACQQAKAGGGNTYRFFTRTMNLSASEFIAMEHRMKSALSNHDFVLHYQPYWDIHTRKMVGMEALIRCQNPDGEMIPPGRFIPVLEKTGLIIEVGEWVIREAIRQIGAWQKAGYALLPVSINLSPIQFRQKDLTSIIQKELIEHGVSPFQFAAEITESAFMEDLEYTRSMLQSLREAGLSISIDDFGTGYSSLSYLKKLPVDNLKIDISFIRELGLDPDAEPIVAAIVTMAKALNLKTIAEGVETEDQWEFLRHLGCDTVQGFFMSPPLPADKVERLFS